MYYMTSALLLVQYATDSIMAVDITQRMKNLDLK
jgi:hypothetical protein